MELIYSDSRVLLRIRDDGNGVDDAILTKGRSGHWGLSGMRERSQKIGAELQIWSQQGAGTEVELSIPAKVAYQDAEQPRLLRRIKAIIIKS